MNAKWPLIVVVVAVVVGAAAFFGGMSYAKGKPPTVEAAVEAMRNASSEEVLQALQNGGGLPGGPGGGFPGFGGGGRQGGGQGGGLGGLVSGEIISADAESITVQLQDGSSKIVFFSGSTSIARQAEGSASDLSEGTIVAVTGAANADGSITAQNIQIRPAGAPPLGGPGVETPVTPPTS